MTAVSRFLLLCLLLAGSAVRGQWRPFLHDIPLNDAGTPIRVHDMATDQRQYLWLATDDGLYRYNGRSFTPIPDSTEAYATTLAIAPEGLWVGYSDGTLAWCDGQNIYPVAAATGKGVSDILRAPWGIAWGTEGNGIYLRLITGPVLHFSTADGLADDFVYDLGWDASGKRLLAATDQGIAAIGSDGKIGLLPHVADTGYDKISRCLGILPAGPHSFVLRGTQQGGLWSLLEDRKGQVLRNCQVPQSAAFGQVNDVDVHNGIFWAGTEEGYLLRLEPDGTCLRIADSLRLPGKKVYKVITDQSGTLWAATSQGLTSLTVNYLDYLPLPQEFDIHSVFSLASDKRGGIWYTQNEDLYECRGETVQKRYTAQAPVTALYNDSSNTFWIGTLGKGLIGYREGGKAVVIGNVPSLVNGHILSITGTGRRLWVSSLNGVDELEQEEGPQPALRLVQHHSKRSGIGSDYVYRLYADKEKRIWMATDGGGISMYDGTRYHHWDTASGFRSKVVYTLTEDAYGHIWASTLEDGLYRYDGRRWTGMNHGEGLEDTRISAIAANATGQVVIVNQSGVDVWLPVSRSFRSFNRNLGLSLDTVSQVLNCIATAPAGPVYVPFEHGLLRVGNMNGNIDIRPSIVLTGVELFSHRQAPDRHAYASNENYLSFHFEGIAQANPEKLHYRYRLEGHNNGWIPTSDESVSFPQLRPGRYVFKVQASLHSSFNDAVTAQYAFTIAAPLWRRPWFVALAVVLVLGLVFSYIRLRERNLRKMSLLQRERMIFEYEHLKSQVNPHFLFNSLNTLVSLIEEDPHAAVDYTVQLSDLYRNALANRDRDLIRLSEEWSILEKYLYIQQSRFGAALQLHTNVSEEQMRSRRIVPLALQLLVENAIKHNVVSRSQPLTISILSDGDSLRVSNNLQQKATQEKGAGLGLENIRKRYALITRKPVLFGIEDHEFVVTLPLL